MLKRIMSIIMAFALVCTIGGTIAFAAESERYEYVNETQSLENGGYIEYDYTIQRAPLLYAAQNTSYYVVGTATLYLPVGVSVSSMSARAHMADGTTSNYYVGITGYGVVSNSAFGYSISCDNVTHGVSFTGISSNANNFPLTPDGNFRKITYYFNGSAEYYFWTAVFFE